MTRIVSIVDDVSSARASTSFLLRGRGYQTCIFENGGEFLKAAPTDGCAVLKMHMPSPNGLEIHEMMIARGNRSPVIFLDGDVPLAVRAMQQGAVDFIALPYDPDDLVRAIERALKLADKDQEVRRSKTAAVSKLNALTPRGIQILQGLRLGMANARIAHWLDLSSRTVEAHRATMMADMGASSLSQAVRIAIDGDLPPIDEKGAALARAH